MEEQDWQKKRWFSPMRYYFTGVILIVIAAYFWIDGSAVMARVLTLIAIIQLLAGAFAQVIRKKSK